jgi:hypothetical protein
MVRTEFRQCATCGRRIALTRFGTYRRHFAIAPDRRRRALCPASQTEPAGVVGLLKTEPTPEQRYTPMP